MSKYGYVKVGGLKGISSTYNIYLRKPTNQLYIRKKIGGKDTSVKTPFFNDKKDDLRKLIKNYHTYEDMCIQKRKDLDSKLTLEKLNNTNEIVMEKVVETISYPTFKEWGDMIFETLYVTYKGNKEKKKGRSKLNKLNEIFGDKLINEITTNDIENWRNDWYKNSEFSSSTIKSYRDVLYKVFDKGVKSELISKNPTKGVSNTKNKKTTDKSKKKDEYGLPFTYTYEEIITMISGCDYFINKSISKSSEYTWKLFKTLLTVGFFSGVRINELISLKWSDLNYDKKTIRVQRTITDSVLSDGTKTMGYRTTILLPIVVDTLNEFKKISKKKDDFLFIHYRNDTYTNGKNLNDLFKKLTQYCKYEKIDLYNMRHSFITLMLSVGKPTEWVLQKVGHTDVVTTKGHYIGKIEDRKDLYQTIFHPTKVKNGVTNISENGLDINIPTIVSGKIPMVTFDNQNTTIS